MTVGSAGTGSVGSDAGDSPHGAASGDILIVGINHRSAPVEVRERFAFEGDGALEAGLKQLFDQRGVDEVVIVSTCNRVEIVAYASDPDGATENIQRVFLGEGGEPLPQLYRLKGREAVRHLFRVAASLDSMVVGEPQILGQVKESYATAAALGVSRTVLHRCFDRAFAVAKKVRRETGIATRAVSVASAAVELAQSIFEGLEGRTAMLIGAGEMSVLTARHLQAHGLESVLVTNRTFDRAVDVARECRGTPVPFEQFGRYLHLADLVVGAVGAGTQILRPEMVRHVLRLRKQAPMLLIDLAVPRCFVGEINEIDNVYLFDVDDLQGIAQTNQEQRIREAGKAEVMIDDAVASFWRWFESLDVVPTIVALRKKMERIRLGELERSGPVLGSLTPAQRNAVEHLTAAIVNKIVHGPITRLKRAHGSHTSAEQVNAEIVRRLFDIPDGADTEEDD